jgi:hypothetical protein
MYKELLARLKDQRESLDQSIVMLEEHINSMEHDKEVLKSVAPGMGEPISITGDPMQHKFMHLAKGIVDKTNKHLPKEEQLSTKVKEDGGISLYWSNPTKDPLAHLFADGQTPKPKEIETKHSISKPMDLDHLVNTEPKDNIHVVIQILNVDTAEVQETHVYKTYSSNKNFAIELARDRQAALGYLIKEKYPKRNLETSRRYTYSLHSDNFPKETGDLFIYEANGGKN